jgi:hypothetical protein
MKNKRNKKHKLVIDVLNAVKAKQRYDEIIEHGKLISVANVVKSKKVYSRKKKHKKKIEE